MTEALFPVVGAAFVVSIVLPLFAGIAKGILVFLERDGAGGPLHGLNLRYLVLIGSSLLPLAWFLSAGLHQTEPLQSSVACLFAHETAEICWEPGFFAACLALSIFGLSLPSLRRSGGARAGVSPGARRTLARIDALIAERPALTSLAGRILVTDEANFALGTQGMLRLRIVVGTSFAGRLSDEILASALGHEAEHLRAFDPLRYLLLRVALAVNPLGGSLLAPHANRWLAAREAQCDREAVIAGSSPLALAEAIIQAARPGPLELVALGASDTRMLRLRIGMLLAYSERHPSRCCHWGRSAAATALGLMLVAILLPHQMGTAALDVLHLGIEQALTFFWR